MDSPTVAPPSMSPLTLPDSGATQHVTTHTPRQWRHPACTLPDNGATQHINTHTPRQWRHPAYHHSHFPTVAPPSILPPTLPDSGATQHITTATTSLDCAPIYILCCAICGPVFCAPTHVVHQSGSVISCPIYRWFSFILWIVIALVRTRIEIIRDGKIRKMEECEMGEEQQGFRRGRGKADGMSTLRQLVEKETGGRRIWLWDSQTSKKD